MALNIEGASIGFDINNIEAAINNLNVRCIGETIELMTSGFSEIQSTVDSVWVGASAEQFKNNIKYDIDNVAKALEETKELLKAEMYHIVNEMTAVDEVLVEAREK